MAAPGFLPASHGYGNRRWHRDALQRGNVARAGGHHPAGRGAAAPGDTAVGAWESGACRREPPPARCPPQQHPGPRHPPAAALSLPWARGLGLWDWCAPQGKLRAAQAGDGSSHGTQPCHPSLPPARPAPPAPSRSHGDKLEPGSLQVLGGCPPANGAPGPGASSPSQGAGAQHGRAVGAGVGGHPLTFPGLSWTAMFPPALCLQGCGRPRPPRLSCVPPGPARGDERQGRAHTVGPPPWHTPPGSDHCRGGSMPAGQPRRQLRAPTGCARGMCTRCTWRDAHVGCTHGVRCRVLAGGGASQLPGARPSWVLRYGCRSCGARRSRYCCSPARPLKSGDFLPQFYGPICLRRALPPAINHSALGDSGERGAAGRMPTALAPARGTSQTHVRLGQEKDLGLCPMALPGWHRNTHYGMAAGPCSSD